VRKDATFIAVQVDDQVASDHDLAVKLSDVCPVDIFAVADGAGVEIVEQNLDECVLCRLCLDASPPGAVKIIKLYDSDALLS
jgi:NAD-dependent dihydropyrimidine dehydrogenase PreA subunit